MIGRWRATAVVCSVVLLLAGCKNGTESIADSETLIESMEATQEDAADEVSRIMNSISFTIHESPVDLGRYDFQTDRIYKNAFFNAVTNQIPIYIQDSEAPVYYRDLLQDTGKMSEEELHRYILQSDFYYQDFDGDGLPELTVNTEGPCVLKYNAEKDIVELYYSNGHGFNLLGTGQMFYYSNSSNNPDDEGRTTKYACETIEHGQVKHNVILYQMEYPDGLSGWTYTYKVSVDESEEFEVNEEEWRKLIAAYFDAKALAPHPMSFSAVFGDEKSSGYVPGSEPKLRYLEEELQLLPLNEETGEEWEAYKTMLRGDFSLVEDEGWANLQWCYEANLESGAGTCDWNYFLMDFNQDGSQELCIRLYPDGVNNTALFRYEDGHIKLWGESYNSADGHGYELPLRNGKMLSGYWYQNDQIRWIGRLDEDFYMIRERSYSSGMLTEEESNPSNELREEEGIPYYSFQDYYNDGQPCGAAIDLTEEEWTKVEAMIEELMIPEDAWKSCSVFTPLSDRPEIPEG